MRYEFNIPFVYSYDEDIDTTVFKDPFLMVVFDGNKRMVDDTAYNSAFAKRVLKKKQETPAEKPVIKDTLAKKKNPSENETKVILAGRVFMNGKPELSINNKAISILNKNGEVLKSTYTNRFGAFCFTGVRPVEIAAVVVKMDEADMETPLFLMSSKNQSVSVSQSKNGSCAWTLSSGDIVKLTDNQYTTNIGGKLIYTSAKQKKFFSKQEVFLVNRHHTVIKKTITNLLGTFVFEDIKPDNHYYISIDRAQPISGERVDLLSKEDVFLGSLDSLMEGKKSIKIASSYNKVFNELSVDDEEMKMDIKATIYGDNINTPIGKLKIILLNDNYEVIDSAITDNFGTFKFKYLPFLKRFYLSAENSDNMLDVFKDIIIYSNDDNLIKIMTHQKGKKFTYNPVSAEMSSMRDLELDDPWLEFVGGEEKPTAPVKRSFMESKKKSIVENILFETGKYEVTEQSKEILDKIILVLHTNQKLMIEVGAHTDSQGSDASNMRLSQLRAKTVQDYISKAGIEPKRIIAKGYGETKLLNACADNTPCSEREHAQNRRIEFKILGE
jgi:outer membrane protein OmpA-like peptidoglycan-associated protein